MNTRKTVILAIMIIVGILSRTLPLVLPHMWSFTAIGALAIFSGAKFDNKYLAFLIPILSMLISDIVFFGNVEPSVYISLIAMILLGYGIRNRQSIPNVVGVSVLGALVFFLITNFAFFYPVQLYPHSANGIITAYIAGVPFMFNMVLSNIVFSIVYFLLYTTIEQRILATSIAK